MTPSRPDAGIAAATLILRVALGVMFIAHALLKAYVFTLAGTAQFFESIGLPGWLGVATFYAELVGGALLILGIHVRKVSIALLPVLVGALWVHLPNGWLFSATNGGWEYPAFLAVAVVVQALLGEGALALRPASRITHRSGGRRFRWNAPFHAEEPR